MNNLGQNIKLLRKKNKVSQEVLAQYLGVSYQAVSKWENMTTMPDISLLPAIATFFKVSIDELFDYQTYSIESQALDICDRALEYRYSAPHKAKVILEEGLERFPGNENIMNHLLYVLSALNEYLETINICKALIQSTKDLEVKYDAIRILINTYYEMGEDRLVEEYIDSIPEIYFTKQELMAKYLHGERAINAAIDQKNQSLFIVAEMILEIINEKKDMTVTEKNNQIHIADQILKLIESDVVVPEDSIYDLNSIKEEFEQIKKQL